MYEFLAAILAVWPLVSATEYPMPFAYQYSSVVTPLPSPESSSTFVWAVSSVPASEVTFSMDTSSKSALISLVIGMKSR